MIIIFSESIYITKTNECCKKHDKCTDKVGPGEIFHTFNTITSRTDKSINMHKLTISSCECDNEFKNYLTDTKIFGFLFWFGYVTEILCRSYFTAR